MSTHTLYNVKSTWVYNFPCEAKLHEFTTFHAKRDPPHSCLRTK